MNTPNQSQFNYIVIFEKEEAGGYHASCPALKGCHSQGDSFEEASANISEAIELYIESLRADQEPIPMGNPIIQQICVSV
jgi:predicted RNase H-like HicB family nuclease